MALALQTYTFAQQYVYSWLYPAPKKNDHAIKIGVLSSANINAASIIRPSETHPDVILYAIASRDAKTAEKQARKYNFLKHYGSYEELLEDPAVEMVYIFVPNGLHYEWATKALEAGKHVLLEKPLSSNATEAKKLAAKAEGCGRILMEGLHWQFHPAAHSFKGILESGKYGKVVKTYARMTSTPETPAGDIRWHYELAGGSLMDQTEVVSFTRYALGAEAPVEVVSAKARPAKHDARVDAAMEASMWFQTRDGYRAYSSISTDMDRAWAMKIIPRLWELPSIEVELEKATIYFYNPQLPHVYHYIAVHEKETGKTTYQKQYSDGPQWKERGKHYWSSYRYQLEAFVDRVRKREPVHWIPLEDSIAQMQTLDEIYKKSGLPLRTTSVLATME
jgi:predicted dehydrogenase